MTSEVLRDNVREACIAIAHFRRKLAVAKRLVSDNALQTVHLHSRRMNYQTLYAKLKLVAIVHQTQPKLQLLLATSDFAPAIELIETTKEVLRTELSGVHSLRYVAAINNGSLTSSQALGCTADGDVTGCARNDGW